MNLLFTFKTEELIDALSILEPYIEPARKEDVEEEAEVSKRITIPKLYFGDKVTFRFSDSENVCFLSTYANDVHIEITCNLSQPFKEISFCMSLPYLLQELETCQTEYIRFEEDRFFGFIIFDAEIQNEKRKLFEVEAFSVRNQKEFYPNFYDTLYPHGFQIEKEFFLNSLKELYKYCSILEMRKELNGCWFTINNGICKVTASNGHILSTKTFVTNVVGSHCISIPGAYALRIFETVNEWKQDYIQIRYNENYVEIYDFNTEKHRGISIDIPRNETTGIQIQKILSNNCVIHKAEINTTELLSCIKRISTFGENRDICIMLHFLYNHVNIHYIDDIWNISASAFLDVINCHESFLVKLNVAYLNILLSDIHTEKLRMYFTNKKYIYILNEDEEIDGDTFRFVCLCLYGDKDIQNLERLDASLLSHKMYKKKYL